MKTHLGRRFFALLGVALVCELGAPGASIASDGPKSVVSVVSVVSVGPIPRISVNSTNVASIGYNADARVLEVEFRSGRIYRFFDVPAASYHDFLLAGSKGRHFARQVRGKYPFMRMEEPKK